LERLAFIKKGGTTPEEEKTREAVRELKRMGGGLGIYNSREESVHKVDEEKERVDKGILESSTSSRTVPEQYDTKEEGQEIMANQLKEESLRKIKAKSKLLGRTLK